MAETMGVKISTSSTSERMECPHKTFTGINNPLNLKWKRPKLSCTIVVIIVIITLAVVLESAAVSSLPTAKSKSRTDKDHHHHHSHSTRHHHRRSKHHQNHLAELEKSQSLDDDSSSGSLSIVSPIDVLRKNMLMEMQKTRIRHAKNKLVEENREYLERIG